MTSMLRLALGDALLQTGHALQRVSARIAGKNIAENIPYKSVGSPLSLNTKLVFPTVYGPSNFSIHSSALLSGNVVVDPHVTIGENCVLRAEENKIVLNVDSVIEDDVTIIANMKTESEKPFEGLPRLTNVGVESVIGAGSVLSNCYIEPNVIIGKNCVISDDARVCSGAIIEDNSHVPAGAKVPAHEIWGGNPLEYKGENEDH
eukprot:maker-scaffold_5-snap-gene-6.46-mRNA-1 protein AED:0.00 eAED:0.00 QI:57/1/1/1/1/1/2/31/203